MPQRPSSRAHRRNRCGRRRRPRARTRSCPAARACTWPARCPSSPRSRRRGPSLAGAPAATSGPRAGSCTRCRPSRCCSSVNQTLKSELKSPPNDDAQGNVHPIRRLYACSFASGARDTADERDVVVRQVHGEAVEPVRDRRAGRAPRRVVGPEHEVVDEELRAPLEEVRQRGAPLVGVEPILLCRSGPTAAPAAAAPARRCAA